MTISTLLGQRINQLSLSEVNQLEDCLGYSIDKVKKQINGNGRILRGYTPRYYTEIMIEYKAEENLWNFEILRNSIQALDIEIFDFCLRDLLIDDKSYFDQVIEIEFRKDIAIPNRLAEIKNGMYAYANNYIDQFILPNQYYQLHYNESEYFRSASREVQVKIRKEFEMILGEIVKMYLAKIEQSPLTENKLDFENFNTIRRNFESEIDNVLAEIINRYR